MEMDEDRKIKTSPSGKNDFSVRSTFPHETKERWKTMRTCIDHSIPKQKTLERMHKDAKSDQV